MGGAYILMGMMGGEEKNLMDSIIIIVKSTWRKQTVLNIDHCIWAKMCAYWRGAFKQRPRE